MRREPRERERETLLCASVSAENEPSSETRRHPVREGESAVCAAHALCQDEFLENKNGGT